MNKIAKVLNKALDAVAKPVSHPAGGSTPALPMSNTYGIPRGDEMPDPKLPPPASDNCGLSFTPSLELRRILTGSAPIVAGSHNVERLRSKFGTPPQVFQKIRESAGTLFSKSTASAIKELSRQWGAAFALEARIASKSPARYREEHLAQLGRMVAEGSDLEDQDGFSESEWQGDQSAKLDALKQRRLDIARELWGLGLPALQKSAEAARKLLVQQIEAEAVVAREWGLPYEPSEIVKSLGEAVLGLEHRISGGAPEHGAKPSHILNNLIDLE